MKNINNLKHVWFSVMICSLSLSAEAQEVIVDQHSTNVYTARFRDAVGHGPLGQEFRPTLNILNFVDLFYGVPNAENADFMVSIHAATITGSALGSSSVLNLGFGHRDAPVRFEFPVPVTLTPGQLYVLEISQLTAGFAGLFGESTQSTDGRIVVRGEPLDGSAPLWFREGVVLVPEPNIWWLSGLGIALVAWYRKYAVKPKSTFERSGPRV